MRFEVMGDFQEPYGAIFGEFDNRLSSIHSAPNISNCSGVRL